jgi:hypothetical protein
VIVLVYLWLAHCEEQQMLARFGEAYRDYQRQSRCSAPAGGQWHQFAQASRNRQENDLG